MGPAGYRGFRGGWRKQETLRHIILDGEPWFVAADVCRILGIYERTNDRASRVKARMDPSEYRKEVMFTPHPRWMGKTTHRYLKRVGADEKRTVTRCGGGDQIAPLFSDSRVGSLTLVSESGLYKLILRANTSNPKAREFQDWVTKVVLPAIRKTGGYCLNEAARETAGNFRFSGTGQLGATLGERTVLAAPGPVRIGSPAPKLPRLDKRLASTHARAP